MKVTHNRSRNKRKREGKKHKCLYMYVCRSTSLCFIGCRLILTELFGKFEGSRRHLNNFITRLASALYIYIYILEIYIRNFANYASRGLIACSIKGLSIITFRVLWKLHFTVKYICYKYLIIVKQIYICNR